MDDERKLPKVVTGIYIFNSKGEVLLVRAPHWANKLVVPGGHVEYRELAEVAAIRETKEEIGLDIKDLEFLRVLELIEPLNYGVNHTHLVGLAYKAKLANENQEVVLDAKEGTEYFWLKPEDAVKRDDVESFVKTVVEEFFINKHKKSFFSHECKDCEKFKAECEEYKSGWQRALADYKNLQKEIETRRGEWAKLSEVQIIEEFLPVYEHLKTAVACHSHENGNPDSWLEGVNHVLKQFSNILKSHGLEEIKTIGEKFDPAVHEAVGEETVEDKEPGEVIHEVDSGYKLGNRVIKAARVIVSK